MFICGKTQSEVGKLIAGEDAYICNECVDVCLDLVQTSQQVETGDWASRPLPKPHEIRAALDQYVIGQDIAKNIVCSCLQPLQASESQPEWTENRR